MTDKTVKVVGKHVKGCGALKRASEIVRAKHDALGKRSYPPPKLLTEVADLIDREADRGRDG